MAATFRPTVTCACFSRDYKKTTTSYPEMKPTWTCTNCFAVTPRKTVHRRTNDKIALDAYLEIKAQWKPLDERLAALIAAGKVMNGALLVHASAFDFALNPLLDHDKSLTRSQIQYYISRATENMKKAEQFINEKEQAS